MSGSTEASDADPSRGWGIWGWARWVPEIANAFIIAMAAFGAYLNLTSYSDEEIRQSLVDTYEPSAWTLIQVCTLSVVGIACALLTRAASRRPTRRRVAVIQLVLMVAAVAVAAYGHHRLMRRTTALTGQTFGGFP
jgi:hypothetical protein